jgi:hypothetical protein
MSLVSAPLIFRLLLVAPVESAGTFIRQWCVVSILGVWVHQCFQHLRCAQHSESALLAEIQVNFMLHCITGHLIHLLWENILEEVVKVADSHSYQVYGKCVSQQNGKSK